MAGHSIFAHTIADLSWPQVEAAGQREALMLLPVAVIEQHGPHLPLATDTYGAYLLCVHARKALNDAGIEALVAPPYYFGINWGTRMFPGSLTISRDLMISLLEEIMENYAGWGFRRQFVVSHHGDPQHNHAVVEAIRRARDRGIDAVLTLAGFVGPAIEEGYAGAFGTPLPLPEVAIVRASDSEHTQLLRKRATRSLLHVHAEERETSMIMRWFPDTLGPAPLESLAPVLPTMDEFNRASAEGRWRELSPLGYIGDPAVATNENGELYRLEAEDLGRAIAHHVNQTTRPADPGR